MARNLLSALGEKIADSLPKTGILVWYDEGGTLQDLVKEAAPRDVELLMFEGSYLTIRAQIETEKDFTKKRLVYVTEGTPSPSWLRDYELFGARLDLALPALLSQFFAVKLTKDLNEILTPQNCRRLAGRWNQVLGAVETPLPEKKLKEALLATAFGQPHPFDVKRAILTYLTYTKGASRELNTSGLSGTFLEILQKGYGLKTSKGKGVKAQDLAATVLLTEFVMNSGGLAEEEFSDLLPEKGRRGFWAGLAAIWPSSVDFRDNFLKWSRRIEKEYNIPEKIKGRRGIENVLSFRAVDEALLDEVKARVGGERFLGILKNADFIRRVAQKRSSLIWTHMGLFKEWKILSISVDLLMLIRSSLRKVIKEGGGDASFLVKSYTSGEGWWRIDNLYRQLASLDVDVDPEIRDLFIVLPGWQYQNWLRRMGGQLSTAFEGKVSWGVDGAVDPKAFWKEFVHLNRERIAVFLIDAMRYELQRKMVSQLQESGLRVNHMVMLSTLPSITKVGMACLLPHKRVSIQITNGRLQVFLDGKKVSTKGERQEWLRSKYGNQVVLADLDALKNPKALAKDTKGARLLVVMDREIDKAGSFISGELLNDFDKLTDRVKRGVDMAIKAGYSKVVVTTDHGFLFLPYPDEVDILEGTSFGSGVASGRRYAVGRPPKVKGAFSMPFKTLGYEGEDFQALFPRGISQFSSPGPREAFVHGGVSLQECCIGVLECTPKKGIIGEKVGVKVSFPSVISSAIFIISLRPLIKQISDLPRSIVVELLEEDKLILRSDPIEIYNKEESLTLKLPRIPKEMEVKVKDYETEEVLFRKTAKVSLEGYDEML